MKKRTVLIMVALLLIPIAALSYTPAEWMRASTGNTADAAIQAVPGYFYGIIVHTRGSGVVIFDAYDNDASAAGDKLLADFVVTSSATDRTQSISYNPPVAYNDGIYVDVDLSTGGTVSYDIFYHEN